MSGSMVSKSFGYFEGNRCSLEVVSLEEKKKEATCFFLMGKYWLVGYYSLSM